MADLSIHVLNSGVGESIVVGLPNGKWGVVDCYASNLADPSSNATLNFLLHQSVSELEFLCLTHPHFDHYRGLSHLLQSFKIRYFWRFGAFCSHDLQRLLLKYVKSSARESDDSEFLENASELTKSLNEAMKRHVEGKIKDILFLSDLKHLYPRPAGSEGELEIKSIAPSSNNIARYQEDLHKCFDDEERLIDELPFQRHNDVSAAISIRYGNARVILCGDVEIKNWNDTQRFLAADEFKANGVKVSH